MTNDRFAVINSIATEFSELCVPCHQDLLSLYEQMLPLLLPPVYREFLLRCGGFKKPNFLLYDCYSNVEQLVDLYTEVLEDGDLPAPPNCVPIGVDGTRVQEIYLDCSEINGSVLRGGSWSSAKKLASTFPELLCRRLFCKRQRVGDYNQSSDSVRAAGKYNQHFFQRLLSFLNSFDSNAQVELDGFSLMGIGIEWSFIGEQWEDAPLLDTISFPQQFIA